MTARVAMLRRDERYNIRETEARWQAAWGMVAPPADGESSLSQARGRILQDVWSRYCQAASIHGNSAFASGGAEEQADPAMLVEVYGTDALRLALVSDVPPVRRLPWRDSRLDGAWRFVHRVWHLVAALSPRLQDDTGESTEARRGRALLASVDTALASGEIHKAVAGLRALGNGLADWPTPAVPATLVVAWLRMLAPVLPHLCQELWYRLGREGEIAAQPWPDRTTEPTAEAAVTIALQVNGRRRGELRLPRDANPQFLQRAALAHPAVARHMGGLSPRRVIVVPNRIFNVVV